jgi:hypothetical protein
MAKLGAQCRTQPHDCNTWRVKFNAQKSCGCKYLLLHVCTGMSCAVQICFDECLHVLGLDSLASGADMADAQVLLGTFQDGFPLIDQPLPVVCSRRRSY